MEKETTNNEILQTVNKLSKTVDVLSVNVNGLSESVNEILGAVNEFSTKVDEKFESIDKRFDKIEAVMVTKDYLDEKLADLRGDLVVLIRKEDTKVKRLVDILLKRKIISEIESNEIFTMEPFAKISL